MEENCTKHHVVLGNLTVCPNQIGFESLKKLVAKLDVKVTDTGRIHVYYCEYAKAEDLAATLQSLATGGSSSSSSSNSGNSRSRNTRPIRPSRAQGGASSPISAELEGGIKITADAATNALVITANSTDYQTLKKVIRKLDIPRLQVFVETAILEVAVDDTQNVGVNLAASAPGRAFAGGFIGDRGNLQSLLTGGLPEGATIPIFAGSRFQADVNGTTVNLRSFTGLINLLTRTTNSSVLSTPQIIALDNEEAVFKVQDEIPVQTGIPGTSVGAATGSSVGTIDTKKVGIEIKLTPNVNVASRTVRLDIEQKVDSLRNNSLVPQDLAGIQVATTSRETNTKVVVKDGDFVMLGGLMSDRVNDSVSKVPLLGDIPILGWLFKSRNKTVVKTNLIILLHPRIIGTTLGSAELIEEQLDKRRRFIEENSGEDDHESQVDALRGQLEEQKRRGRGDARSSFKNDPRRNADDRDEPRGSRSSFRQDYAKPDARDESEFYGESEPNEALMVPSDAELDAMEQRTKAAQRAKQDFSSPAQNTGRPIDEAPLLPADEGDSSLLPSNEDSLDFQGGDEL